MQRHWPLLLGALTAVALSACATAPLADTGAGAVDARAASSAACTTTRPSATAPVRR